MEVANYLQIPSLQAFQGEAMKSNAFKSQAGNVNERRMPGVCVVSTSRVPPSYTDAFSTCCKTSRLLGV